MVMVNPLPFSFNYEYILNKPAGTDLKHRFCPIIIIAALTYLTLPDAHSFAGTSK